ncbi:Membrane protein related to Kef-type K+ transport system NAD-binding component [Erythrobacter sp. NAP1]|uniref:potassium channel family protein n=1 Tax=Erythrobacter sp. NAP1 TaxID=237727 RepID=UPI000068779C|nr:potassium channel family protein [Erythrobacter sp. NAP1]EAQ28313.1 Membrane protein related to Kef-type K+ transport system NAD-binding component [Erythrobacter sp. NAP1]
MAAIALSALLIAATILIHYETLRLAARGADEFEVRPRTRLWIMLSSAIVSHIAHVLLYAGGFILLEHVWSVGAIAGPETGVFYDAFYFSITSYTTLGIGDIYPTGQVRMLSGVEALNGLVMVTWTASVTYLFMERHWRHNGAGKS